MTDKKISTICVYNDIEPLSGAVVKPIQMSTSYQFPNKTGEVIYPGSFNTPAQNEVARKMAALEQGEEAIITASGQSAIIASLLAVLMPGDHVLFHAELYGGTAYFGINELNKYGVRCDFVYGSDIESFRKEIRPNTRAIYFESPTNPVLTVIDFRKIVSLAKEIDAVTIIDSTFGTPVNQTPLACGVDIVVHSGTKYLNGHSDVSCGVIVTSSEFAKKIKPIVIARGAILHPQASYLLDRGLKTLSLRVAQQNKNALEIARFLEEQENVEKVYYPGLESHKSHHTAKLQMNGFGGMVSFVLTDLPDDIARNMQNLSIIHPAVSLGGVESLICLPSQTSQRMMSSQMRSKLNISDSLVRLSVGIEDTEDLIEDLKNAFFR